MQIEISKKDVMWGYIAQFFSMAAGLIVLPMVLHKLTAEEVGMNYLMLTIGTIVSLFDFGFAPQFSRNVTYVFSGAQVLRKEGVRAEDSGREVNYHLLGVVIETAKFIYKRLSLIVLLVMLTAGTGYIYYITHEFTNVNNAFVIWIIYSISVYFNLYYIYYSSLLEGAALIAETKKAMIYSKLVYMIIAYILLLTNAGLLSVVIANLISPFVSRFYSYYKFYTPELKEKLKAIQVDKAEIKDAFNILWYNAKKLGINFVGAYAITKASMFLAGIFLSLKEVGSLGIMIQLFSIVSTLSMCLFMTYQPKFNKYRVQGDNKQLVEEFSFTMIAFYVLYILGSLLIIFIGNNVLSIIKSNTLLPNNIVLVLFASIILLENTHSSCASILVTKNEVPFVKAAILSGVFIILFTIVVLQFTSWGILGIIIVQGAVQLVYNNWKWPKLVMSDFKISFIRFLIIGINVTNNKIKRYI